MSKSENPYNKLAPVKQETNMVVVDPGMLIAKAIEKGLPVETMEKLLTMRRELRAEAARDDYFIALAKFQKLCPVIVKSRDVYDKYGKLRYRFAPLDVIVAQVKDAIEDCGFSYIIKTEQTETMVKAICEAHHISGHTESTDFTVPIDPDAYMNEAQKVASALTYSKRYAFCNAFGILTGEEDVDANGLGNSKAEAAKKAAAEKNHKIIKTDSPPPKKDEQKNGAPKDPERQKIINRIAGILKNDKFTDEDRAKVRVEISVTKSNTALEALMLVWRAELNKRIEDFKDDDSEGQPKKETESELFPGEVKEAKEAAEKKEMVDEVMY